VTPRVYEDRLRAAIIELQKIASDLEEFGTISASSGTLIRDPKKRFGFELGLTAKELFERNRLEGASALRDLMAYSARGAVRVVPAAAAAANAAAAAVAPEAGGEPPAAEAPLASEPAPVEAAEPGAEAAATYVPVPALPAGAPASGTLPTPTFTPGLEISSDALAIGVRDLIKLSSDDFMTQKLLEWMSAPELQSENKLLFAAVLSVSVRPGWRTYTGYTAEIDLRAGYWCTPHSPASSADETEKRREECIVEGDGKEVFPLAFAVFPAFDAQVLDERSSFRRQLALALAIEAQGPEASGALEQELVRRLEHDLATRSTVNTIAGYNESGVHFGWRFSPKAVAQANPADAEAGPGLLLQPQSFPALVFLVADKSDVPKQFGGVCPNTYDEARELPAKLAAKRAERDAEKELPKKEKLAKVVKALEADEKAFSDCPDLVFDSILFDYSTRWARAPDPGADSSWIPFRGAWSRSPWKRPVLRESRYLDWAAAVANAEATLSWSHRQRLTGTVATPNLEFQLEKKLAQLRAASVKEDVIQEMPKAASDAVTIGAVTPRAIVSGPSGESWFVILGKGFLGQGSAPDADRLLCPASGARPVVTVSGANAEVQDGCSDSVLVVKVASNAVQPVTGKADVAVAAVGDNAGKIGFAKEALTAVASAGLPTSNVEIGWTIGPDGSAHVSSISTRGEKGTALDVVKALSHPPRKQKEVDVNLQLKAKDARPN
jgi:hypothetical protein